MKIQGTDKEIRLIPETNFEKDWLDHFINRSYCGHMKVRGDRCLLGNQVLVIEKVIEKKIE